jgi:hypothetical protein
VSPLTIRNQDPLEAAMLKEEEYSVVSEAGLMTLQGVALLLGFVLTCGDGRIKV